VLLGDVETEAPDGCLAYASKEEEYFADCEDVVEDQDGDQGASQQ
jgi:hypothetical protein